MLVMFTLTEDDARGRNNEIEKLIARMSLGEVSAMGNLYELIGTDVYAYALSKLTNKADAEDITQDTFVHVWRSAKQYVPLGKPLAWIFTVEINLIRKLYTKSKRYVQLEETIEIDDGSDFAEKVVCGEFLRQMLASLSEEEREVVTLHTVSGLKHREIAKLLGRPLSTVLSKYNRAIKKLQVIIKESEESK